MKIGSQSCRPKSGRVILRFVIVIRATRAKILIVLFALAMLYGSVCSASCVVGVCANLEHYSESHDCDQPSHHQSRGSHDHGQHSPDCKQHSHPPDFALKASAIVPLQDQTATVLHAGAVLFFLSIPLATAQEILEESHRRPLGVPKNTLHEQVSVLRI
jgi:hypothetical protein